MLLLEQPAEAKVTIQSGRQTVWQVQWQGFKWVVPLLLAVSVICVEVVVYRLWLDDRLFSAEGVLRLFLAVAFPFIAVVVAVAVPLLFACVPWFGTRSSRRSICLDDKGIKLTQTKYDRVFWKYVRRWFVSPIPGHERFVSLTLECGTDAKPSRRYWSIILEARDQKQAFLSEVEHLRQIERSAAPVIELLQPMPQRLVASRGLWPLALAFCLFVHGFPLLLVGVMPHDPKDSASHSSPAERAKMERLMMPVIRGLHISNENQLRTLFGLTGGLLTAAAAGIFFWGDQRQARQTKETNNAYDLELERITMARDSIKVGDPR